MKRVALALASALVVVAPTAYAADMPLKAPPPPAPVGVNWTGCHVGGTIGASWARDGGYTTTASSSFIEVPPGFPQNFPALGGTRITNGATAGNVIGGADAGCDYQTGHWVFGVEGDWSKTDTNPIMPIASAPLGLTVPAVGGFGIGLLGSDIWSANERWLATARGRLGYASDKWLLYVTGGAAWMNIRSVEWAGGPGTSTVAQTDTRTGWTIGTGLEYAITTTGWSIRAEYLYVKIPNYTTFSPGTGPGYATVGWITNLNNNGMSDNIVRFGLNYKFCGG